ncbi:hypothetical protein [Martelella mediterranea]|uniref:Uncharacterized protein n=1 Tax=Martelella mediterranea TaxID=293089 RepID=A0A4R3P0Y5_9HYPH|nr:hypothetical protein [Martelella mediterranea]TCT39609.1 hypothetical protein EDC90_1012107 [Martelella mediterranea]
MPAFLAKYLSPGVVVVVLLLVTTGLAFLAVREVNGMVKDARASAVSERDAFWKGEIAEANAAKNEAVAAQLRAVMLADNKIRAAEAEAETKLNEMERANAALPGGAACGLGPERVRILPR